MTGHTVQWMARAQSGQAPGWPLLLRHEPKYWRDCTRRSTSVLGQTVRSVGSKGDSHDNAAAEAVNSLYKKELINHEGSWKGAGQVTVATAEWVSWYNNDRLHSTCG